MTQQMREMEVLMARERAELARQRSEIQRIQDEIRQELERMEKDRGLNEKLVQLRQRFQNVAKVRPSGTVGEPTQVPVTPPPTARAPVEDGTVKRKDSGLMRRLFGQ
jgi:hypothetical protein